MCAAFEKFRNHWHYNNYFFNSIKDLSHDRTALPRTVYKVRVTCTAETIDREQSLELKGALEEAYGEDLHWEDMMVANYNVNNNNKKLDLNNNCFL